MSGTNGFGEFVRERRHQLGMSQRELADIADLGQTVVSSAERGKTVPSFDTVAKFSVALDVPVTDLLRLGGMLHDVEFWRSHGYRVVKFDDAGNIVDEVIP